MDYIEVTGKTVDDAITEACQKLEVTSDRLEYEVIEKGTSGFLGFASKPAVIKARVKNDKVEEVLEEIKEKVDSAEKAATEVKETKEPVKVTSTNDPKVFLNQVFNAMGMEVNIDVEQKDNEINIELSGDDMGVLIGKRGQTLDSLQYLTSLYVNKGSEGYIRVKVDTENYRKRRKEIGRSSDEGIFCDRRIHGTY